MATEPKIAGAAVRAAAVEILAERAAAEGDQVELFPLPVADAGGDLERIADTVRKGPGRPTGASSKSTVALRAYLLSRGVLPQQAMMQFVQLGPIGLAKVLGDEATRLERERTGYPPQGPVFTPEFLHECAKTWSKMAADLGRYFMAPQAPQDGEGKALPTFLVSIGGGGSGVTAADGSQLPPWAYIDIQQNQYVSEDEPAQSQESESQE